MCNSTTQVNDKKQTRNWPIFGQTPFEFEYYCAYLAVGAGLSRHDEAGLHLFREHIRQFAT